MLKFIIRLDDACPTMKEEKWKRVEEILDKYEIKPIVGIIPDCKDKEFNNPVIDNFWQEYALKWQKKGWIIAQHGLNHNLSDKIRTEYRGVEYNKQKENLIEGYNILSKHNIKPTCFFAPAHTFDKNTIMACKNLNYFKFISDGVAIYPYKKNGMVFLPNIFDTPHKILNFGVFTFVYHPNKMLDKDFLYLEEFIKKNINNFDVNIDELIIKYNSRKRNLLDLTFVFLINFYRKIKGTKR